MVWTVTTSMPASSRWVAKECRRVCSVTALVKPLRFTTRWQSRCKEPSCSGRAAGKGPGDQQGGRPITPPVGPQFLQQTWGQGDETVLASFAFANVNDQAGAVDVGDLQVEQFAAPQAAGIGELQEHALAAGPGGVDQEQDFVRTEDRGQGPRLFAVGDDVDQFRLAEGGAIEEAQGADDLVVPTPGSLLLEQVDLERAHVLSAQVGRGAVEVPGETDDTGDISMDGLGRIVADTQVVDETLSKRGQERSPRRGKETSGRTPSVRGGAR